MSARTFKGWAVAGLVLAIALVGFALRAGLQAADLQGPGTIGLTPQGEVWLQVDRAFWRLSADGHRLGTQALADTGLPAPPSHLAALPDGSLLATVRGEAALYRLDPATLQVRGRVTPQWPGDLQHHADRAITPAVAPDGRLAIATGGGHTVALFDAQGRFLARTAADTYRFTNGLWWDGNAALWTTDTNRFALKRLDGHTLAVTQVLPLDDGAPAPFLGLAQPLPAAANQGVTAAPMAALTRLHNGMIEGRVVLVDASGHETELPGGHRLEPADLAWIGDALVASDGASFRLLRWSAAGTALPDFGDAEVRGDLQRLRERRAHHQREHDLGLAAGIVVFVAAFAAALLGQRAERRTAFASTGRVAGGASGPFTAAERGAVAQGLASATAPSPAAWPPHLARLPARARLRLQWRAFGFWLLAPLLLLPLQSTTVVHALRAALGVHGFVTLLYGVAALLIATTAALLARVRRLARDPAFEPLFNDLALRKLYKQAPLLELQPGEQLRETFMLVRPRETRWVVLTDRRLLLFKATAVDQQFEGALALVELRAASTERGALQPRRGGDALLYLLGTGGWLELARCDGRVLAGTVASPTVARRVVEHITAAAGTRAASAFPTTSTPPSPAQRQGPARAWATAASALIPGLGQWWQRRPAVALLLFLPWAVFTLSTTLPLLWTLYGPRADVAPATAVTVLLLQAGFTLIAALDAWHMGRSPRAPLMS